MRLDAKRLTHAGLRCIIGKNYPDTIIADRVCHGDAAPIAGISSPEWGRAVNRWIGSAPSK